jgi:hypothetical protein
LHERARLGCVPADFIGAAGHDDQDRPPGRGENGIGEITLDTGKGQAGDVAALAGGPVPEHAGPVSHDQHGHVRGRRGRYRGLEPAAVLAGDTATLLVADAGGRELLDEPVEHGRDRQARGAGSSERTWFGNE